MKRTVLPERVTGERANDLALCVAELAEEPGGIVLDAQRTTFWSPFGVCVLATALEQRRLRGLPWPAFVESDESVVTQFLAETSMKRYLAGAGAPPAPDEGDTLRLRHFKGLDAVWPHALAAWLCAQVGGDDDFAYVIEMQLFGLLTNVFDHAFSGIGCFALARWYSRLGNVRLAVSDGGIGIPSSVRRGFAERFSDDDAQLIERAVLEEGLTTRPAGRPGGLGLKNVRGSVLARSGSLTVMSGAASVRFDAETHVERVEFFHGTAIELDFRPLVNA